MTMITSAFLFFDFCRIGRMMSKYYDCAKVTAIPRNHSENTTLAGEIALMFDRGSKIDVSPGGFQGNPIHHTASFEHPEFHCGNAGGIHDTIVHIMDARRFHR
jgi:hypothetical protein